jgi:hypothetical protein
MKCMQLRGITYNLLYQVVTLGFQHGDATPVTHLGAEKIKR